MADASLHHLLKEHSEAAMVMVMHNPDLSVQMQFFFRGGQKLHLRL